nr:amiloride-sensitive cation channel [Cupiennius salei]
MSKGSSARDLSVFESEWFESKEDIHEQESLKAVILNLLQKSSIYAVSQLVTSSGFARRILWFLVLLVGLLGCSYEIYHFLSLYFQYPVVITLEVKNDWKLDFPAVTVCNLNRISNLNYCCLLLDISPKKCTSRRRYKPISERQKYASCSSNFSGNFSDERSRFLTFFDKYLKADERSRSKFGYKSIDLITSCTFNGESCSVGNFTEFKSIQFGNCFTFNRVYGKNGSTLQTPYIGPNSGLEISLSLDSDSYAPITPSIGARVVIHESDVDPNPEDNGINISPGYETSLALQQTSIYRLPEPYRDKCKQYKGEKPSERNQVSCIANCMQNINLHECDCVDPFMPTDPSMPLCDLRNRTTVCCLDDVMKSFSEDNISCSCPLPCKSTDYEMTISTAEWPSERFFYKFLKDGFLSRQYPTRTKLAETNILSKGEEKMTCKEENDTSSSENCCEECLCKDRGPYEEHRKQEAKLKVFYKSLEKISYRQEPMFQDSELFSQLGGQLGLWLGISLVALFECVENLTHLMHYFLKKLGKPKRMNTSYLQDNVFEKITKV